MQTDSETVNKAVSAGNVNCTVYCTALQAATTINAIQSKKNFKKARNSLS